MPSHPPPISSYNCFLQTWGERCYSSNSCTSWQPPGIIYPLVGALAISSIRPPSNAESLKAWWEQLKSLCLSPVFLSLKLKEKLSRRGNIQINTKLLARQKPKYLEISYLSKSEIQLCLVAQSAIFLFVCLWAFVCLVHLIASPQDGNIWAISNFPQRKRAMPEGAFLFGSVGRGSIPFLTSLSTLDPCSKAIRHPGWSINDWK